MLRYMPFIKLCQNGFYFIPFKNISCKIMISKISFEIKQYLFTLENQSILRLELNID